MKRVCSAIVLAVISLAPRVVVAQTAPETLTLDQCIAASLETSRRKAADHQVEVAEARHGQARSSRYPSVTGRLMARRLDEDPNFIFPASTIAVPASAITLPTMAITLPANAFGPNFPPADVPLPIPGGTLPIAAQTFQVPEQNIRLMDRTIYTGTLSAMYALYTGGLASARIEQAKAGIDAARHERRQTAAEIVFDVTRAYYGVVLAQKLHAVSADTLERMRATLDLTESLYKNGSGQVKKTDYLRHSAMVDTLAAMVAEFDAQQRIARASLATLIGRDDAGEVAVADTELPPGTGAGDVTGLLRQALESNPLLGRVQSGLLASKAGVIAARAGHLPKVGLFADLNAIGNSYNAGAVTPQNRRAWAVGFGVEVPLFQGFRVAREVEEARAAQRALEQQHDALRDGVALDVKRTAIAIDKARTQRTSTGNAYQSATENRELHVRAYQDELVETKDMIEAQLVEAVLAGQFFKVQYDLVEAEARMDLILGSAGRGAR